MFTRSACSLPSTFSTFGWTVLMVALLATAGCSQSPLEPVEPDDNVVVDDNGDWKTDHFVTNSAAVDGHRLAVEVSYGGGCETHVFTLVISENFLESDPVQLPALLAHDAKGDPCQAWLTDTLVFDLELVRTRYQEVYGPGPGTVVLNIDGIDGEDLKYNFSG